MLHGVASLPPAHRSAWFQHLASLLGQFQAAGCVHPQQFTRFNELLDCIAADRDLRLQLIDLVHHPQEPSRRLPAADAFFSLMVYLGFARLSLHPRAHRLLLRHCHLQRYPASLLARWYQRHAVNLADYPQHCQTIGAHWLDDETTLKRALRRSLSIAHPDHQGSEQDFHQLKRIGQLLML